MDMSDRATLVRELADDLLVRKVDTIVTEGITGRGMPHPVMALLDINNTYLRKLIRMGKVPERGKDWPSDILDDKGWLLPNQAALAWLTDRALAALDDKTLPGIDACVAVRIVSTCKDLMPISAKLAGTHPELFRSSRAEVSSELLTKVKTESRMYANDERTLSLRKIDEILTRRELTQLTKAWELGGDTVALQTVSMLDGDIITRVTEKYTDETHAVVRQIHREAVNLSFTTWEFVVKSVGSFVDTLLNRGK